MCRPDRYDGTRSVPATFISITAPRGRSAQWPLYFEASSCSSCLPGFSRSASYEHSSAVRSDYLLKKSFCPNIFCAPSFAKPTAHRFPRLRLRVKRFPCFAVKADCFATFSAIPPGCLRISANIRDGSLSEDQIIPKMIAVNGSLSRKGNLPDGL